MTAPESPTWFTSSYSSSNGGECVEVAFMEPTVGVRDTKDRAAGHLAVSPESWAALVTLVRR